MNTDSVSNNSWHRINFTIMEKLFHSFMGKKGCLTCITKDFPRDKFHKICEWMFFLNCFLWRSSPVSILSACTCMHSFFFLSRDEYRLCLNQQHRINFTIMEKLFHSFMGKKGCLTCIVGYVNKVVQFDEQCQPLVTGCVKKNTGSQ